MTQFKLRMVGGEYKACQPWYDYLACCDYVTRNGGTLGEAQVALFDQEAK